MKSLKNKMSRLMVKTLAIATITIGAAGCSDFLDIVPDNVATIDNAFTLRNEAEKYLFTCYSFLPNDGDGWYNGGLMSGDEIFLPMATENHWHPAFRIALGLQNENAPLFDEWSGERKGGGAYNHLKMWRGIKQCNIFIEEMQDPANVPDMTDFERDRWIAEAKMLKAFYHFYLFKMYGPIPIQKYNEDISPEPTAIRMPVDSVVNYVSDLIDESIPGLPSLITDENRELGRMTRSIALAVKAKLWVLAASPLFNGNADYANFVDNEGTHLFPLEYDASKWEKARDAALAAIESAEANGHQLFEYAIDTRGLTDTIETQLSIRSAVTERWSDEHVWALSNSYFINQSLCMPPMERSENDSRFDLQGVWSVPLKIVKQFYSENGVPIEEDKTLDFANALEVRKAVTDERYYIEPNFETARINFDREPRFYADLGFDGSTWYMADGNSSGADENTFYIKAKNNQIGGFGHYINWNETGYFIKKLVHWESSTNGTITWKNYPWPEIRLADLYLLYAEALNETDPGSSLAIEYVDRIRARAGLKGVAQSWIAYSKNPAKFSTQDGLREIIHQERLIELAFEGHRIWDLKRWKKAAEYLNEDITGMNIRGETASTYNTERFIMSQRFIAPRDYLWPIAIDELRKNSNLVQNPGW